MTTVHVILTVAVISTGLFTGLLMTILAFFQKALKDLTASEFALVMHRFLEVVRTHPLNYGLVITSMLAPIAALFMLRESAGGLTFVLVLAGWMAFVAGAVLVSRFFAEPIYNVFLSWKTQSPPENWREARDQYFRLNVIRGLGSGTAFVLFLVSLSLH
ncbi:MAG: DUF1772 domain-containing protein [Actinomycetota bacterium]|jgi:uncharacterized membrane protein|nr:DUF1772 domain-containing protein [Actinomycetota bacterium]